MKRVPNAMQWQFNDQSLKRKQYLKDLDFIKEHTDVNMINIATVHGAVPEGNKQFHDDLMELVEYAHKLGIGIVLRNTHVKGFFNDEPHIIEDQRNAQGLVYDSEGVLDHEGYFTATQVARWARPKLKPLWNRVVKAYVFEKTGEGFYMDGTLEDVTDRIRVICSESNSITVEADLGAKYAGKTIFIMTVQYFNWYDCYGDAMFRQHKATMDMFADIPLDGYCMDEAGYMVLDSSKSHEERDWFRMYSAAQRDYYENSLGIDLDRLLFDMRYAPENDEGVRIRAINRYFEEHQKQPVRIEWEVAEYEKKLWGENVFLTCHNTFHNNLLTDEVWKTGCRWWDLPRDFGHTDENITFPVRMGVSLAAPEPICIDMYYHKEQQPYYDHIIEGAPFNCREFHHSYNDDVWGQGFKDINFLKNIRTLDRQVARLNEFQTERPKLDLLIIFGAAAQFNWYPDYAARNRWDIDYTMKVLEKCDAIWKAGYRCALVPDYAIEDGRITLENEKICFNGYPFTHCLFLYPKYAKKQTYELLNQAGSNGVNIATVGRADIDFDAESASLSVANYAEFDMSVLEKMNCAKSAIPNGCIYRDGSFSLVSHGLLTGEATAFEFEINGTRFTGQYTGLLAYREGKFAFATEGSELFANGVKVDLNIK